VPNTSFSIETNVCRGCWRRPGRSLTNDTGAAAVIDNGDSVIGRRHNRSLSVTDGYSNGCSACLGHNLFVQGDVDVSDSGACDRLLRKLIDT